MSYRQQTSFGGSVSIGMRHWLGEGEHHTGLYRSRECESGEDMSTIESYKSILGGFVRPESGKKGDDCLVNKAVTTTRGPVMDRETRKAFLRQVDDDDDDEDVIVEDVLPLGAATTPVHPGRRVVSSSLSEDSPQALDASAVKSMNKHLDGMFDSIMKEMFSPEVGGKALSFDETAVEEDFTIKASPSPRRQNHHHASSSPDAKHEYISENKIRDENIVLDIGNASPLLRRMREIEERKKNIMPVPSSPAPQAEQTTQDEKNLSGSIEMVEEGRVSGKGVAPLVHYFETGGAQKPPLPGIGHRLKLSYAKLKKKSPARIVRVLEDTIVPYVVGKRKLLCHVGKPRLWAVAAIAYIVLIHILLIGTKLHRQ